MSTINNDANNTNSTNEINTGDIVDNEINIDLDYEYELEVKDQKIDFLQQEITRLKNLLGQTNDNNYVETDFNELFNYDKPYWIKRKINNNDNTYILTIQSMLNFKICYEPQTKHYKQFIKNIFPKIFKTDHENNIITILPPHIPTFDSNSNDDHGHYIKIKNLKLDDMLGYNAIDSYANKSFLDEINNIHDATLLFKNEDWEYLFKYTYNIKNMCSSLPACITQINIDFSNAKDIITATDAFNYCDNIKEINLTFGIFPTRVKRMFLDNRNMIKCVLTSIKPVALDEIKEMFMYCENLEEIEFNNIVFNEITHGTSENDDVFIGCDKLNKIKIKNKSFNIIQHCLEYQTGKHWVWNDNGYAITKW